jgi:putative ABC transport system ATP-binding protein
VKSIATKKTTTKSVRKKTSTSSSKKSSSKSKRAVIKLDNVWKTYKMGENVVHALSGISLDVLEGEFLAIMGPSGSGKSTCMNMVGCLDRPSKGQVLLDGKSGQDIKNFLIQLNKEGKTIIMVTHDLPTARFARRVEVLQDGKIVDIKKTRYYEALKNE